VRNLAYVHVSLRLTSRQLYGCSVFRCNLCTTLGMWKGFTDLDRMSVHDCQGADLSHVICSPTAAGPIKTYSPDLIVHPILREELCV
jgi:hypothetical protein